MRKKKRQPARGDRELDNLMKPFLSLLSRSERIEFKSIWEEEKDGIFSWGVKSGYFLWVRQHPNEKPTKAHLAIWIVNGQRNMPRMQ